jgi:uncharacterized protein (TIGR00297 family)
MEWKRQSIHMAVGLLIVLLRFLDYWALLCVALSGILFNLFFLPRLIPSIMRGVSGDRRGVVFYPIAITTLLIAFPNQKEIIAGAWAILSIGDGMATLVGRMGKPFPLRWNAKKTTQGTLACLVFGAAACYLAIFFVCPELRGDWERWLVGSVLAAVLAAWVESLPLPINDNLTVPATAAAVLWLTGFIDVSLLGQLNGWYMVVAILGNGSLAIILTSFRVIHGSATWAGVVLGSILWVCGGWQCYFLLIFFFILGTGATKHGYERKAWRGVAQEDDGRRGARHVVANCGAPTLLAFLVAATPYPIWMKIAVVASLATALFDTLASEIGQVYGRYPVLPTTGETVPIGTEGAISMEGTLAGLFGSIILAFAGWSLGTYPASAIPIIVVSAFVGSSAESLLGAVLRWDFTWKNEILNFSNTVMGGALGLWIACQTQIPAWPVLAALP